MKGGILTRPPLLFSFHRLGLCSFAFIFVTAAVIFEYYFDVSILEGFGCI